MVEKLKAYKETLLKKEDDLVEALESVQDKIEIINEMILEESLAAEKEEAKPAETAEKAIEFGTLPRSF